MDTRQKIIQAALLVAAKSGFSRATTCKIAKQAGVSEGIIYHYFKSKNDLCQSMIQEHAEGFRHKLLREILQFTKTKDKLDRLIDFHFEYFTRQGNIFQAIYGKSGDSAVMMGHILKVAIIPYAKTIEDIIRQGIKEGSFKTLNPGITASGLLGMMQITIIRLHFGMAQFSIKDAKVALKRIFFEGLLCKH